MTTSLRLIAEDLAFLEGPRWRGHHLYASDIFGHRVYRFDLEGHVEELCTVPGRPSGLGWDNDGNLLIVSMVDQKIVRWHDNKLEDFADLSRIAAGDLNDMVTAADGSFYTGDFGSWANDGDLLEPTRIIRVAPDGTAAKVGDRVVFPNGMVITPDGRTLIVAETYAYRISAFDIEADGSLVGRRDWATFASYPTELSTTTAAIESGNFLPDGICMDSEGALWVGDARGTGAVRVREGGEIVDKIDTPGHAVYAVALGGPSLSTLFMCAAPRLGTWDPTAERQAVLYACEVNVPGRGAR